VSVASEPLDAIGERHVAWRAVFAWWARLCDFLVRARGIAVIAVLATFPMLGSRGLYESTEARYAECAREMLTTRNWLEPTLNGRPHWSKPPLAYWAIAGGMHILGTNEAGVRLTGALTQILTVMVVGLLGRSLFGSPTGCVAALAYATAPFPVLAAWGASTDLLLTLFETLAVYGFVSAQSANGQASRWRTRLAWCAIGLGFATKGPVVLLALVPAVLLLHPSKRGRLFDLLGIALAAVLGLWWFVLEANLHAGLAGYWLGEELIARVTTDSAERNPEWYKPFTIYLPAILLGGGLWVIPAIRRVFDRVRRNGLRGLRSDDAKHWGVRIWIVVLLLLLSLSRSRLPLYVLPVMVPAILLLARHAVGNADSSHMRLCSAFAVASLALILGAKAVASRLESPHDARRLARLVDDVDRDAEVLVYHNENMNGLAFYRDGRLRRVTRTGAQPWADLDLGSAIASLLSSTDGSQVMVVS
jgi:4-amino-4-deoxy-L-arabinose transferase-like glycosyltransferase